MGEASMYIVQSTKKPQTGLRKERKIGLKFQGLIGWDSAPYKQHWQYRACVKAWAGRFDLSCYGSKIKTILFQHIESRGNHLDSV